MLDKICANCHQNANYNCMRCKVESYCSKKCQIAAFPQHRQNCFPLPHLEVIDGKQKISQLATISCDSDDSEKNSVCENKLKNMAIEGKDEKIEILEQKESAEISVNNNIPADPKSKELITPAFNQGVRTVPPNEYNNKTPSVINLPKQMAEKEKIVKEMPKPIVENKVFSNEPMRRSQPIMMNHSMRKPKEMERIFYKNMRFRPLKIGHVKVKLANGNEATKIFYVMESLKDADAFLEHIEDNINNFVKNDKSTSYKPVKGEMVLAKFDGIYYRAVVEDISADSSNNPIYDVFFVDYANTSQVKEDEMKPFSINLISEIIVNPVLLENFPTTITKKEEAILGNEDGFEILVKSQENDYFVATIVGI